MSKDLLGKDYYSQESAKAYWSVSQVKQFLDCEARALAQLNGDWEDNSDKTALLVGNMVHSYFESPEAHEQFMADNADAMVAKTGRTKGQLKTDFKVGQAMIDRLKDDEQFMTYYQGDKEVAVAGEIEGVPFKGKIDCLNLEGGYFVDIKTTKGSTEAEVWAVDKESGHNIKRYWFEAYGYVLQMAVYQELLRQTYERDFMPIIYAVTKEEPSDTMAISFEDTTRLSLELEDLKKAIKRLNDVKTGVVPAAPCGACQYCRATKKTKRLLRY